MRWLVALSGFIVMAVVSAGLVQMGFRSGPAREFADDLPFLQGAGLVIIGGLLFGPVSVFSMDLLRNLHAKGKTQRTARILGNIWLATIMASIAVVGVFLWPIMEGILPKIALVLVLGITCAYIWSERGNTDPS